MVLLARREENNGKSHIMCRFVCWHMHSLSLLSSMSMVAVCLSPARTPRMLCTEREMEIDSSLSTLPAIGHSTQTVLFEPAGNVINTGTLPIQYNYTVYSPIQLCQKTYTELVYYTCMYLCFVQSKL